MNTPSTPPMSAVMTASQRIDALDLLARRADGAQHAQLARALADREHERVHDAEERDDDRQRQQRVDEAEQLVDLAGDVVLELLVGQDLGLGIAGVEQLR